MTLSRGDMLHKRRLIRILRVIKRKRKNYASYIDRFILSVIFINSITLGLETSEYFSENYGAILEYIDTVALAIFTVEILVKLAIKRLKFFKNPWNVFDFIIVGSSYLPYVGGVSMLRSLRILRVFLFISFMPQLRTIVHSLLLAVPGILGISILLIIIFYVFGVIATKSFSDLCPEEFGNLGNSLFSLFQIMTLDNWEEIVKPVVKEKPFAYLFFIPFVIISAYVILNIFIAIIVNGMREARKKNEAIARKRAIAIDEEERRNEATLAAVIDKLNALESQISRLERAGASGDRGKKGAENDIVSNGVA